MAAESDAGHGEKVFEHCEITWKIENYFLATYGEKWIINSPEIYVREPRTKWQLFLTQVPEDEESMCIQLQRLKYDSGPNSVWANWKISLIAMKNNVEKEFPILKHKKSFVNDEFHEDTLERKSILKYIVPPFEDKDTICLRFQLIVSHETVDKTYEMFDADYDLTTLQTFIQDHAVGKEYDIYIKNKSKKIKAHKEILSSRSRYFENQINRGMECITFDLNRMGFSNVIAYLYSGDLKHVLSKPYVLLYDIIKKLKIKELDLYYLPSLIKLNTAQDVLYNEFRWVIENVSDRADGTIITSPILCDAYFKTSWKLELKIKVVNEYMHMSISAQRIPKIVETTQKAIDTTEKTADKTEKIDETHSLPTFIELVPMNGRHDCFPRTRKTKCIQENVRIYEENFFEIKLSKIRSLLPGNELHIMFKIQMLLSRTASKRRNRMIYFFSK